MHVFWVCKLLVSRPIEGGKRRSFDTYMPRQGCTYQTQSVLYPKDGVFKEDATSEGQHAAKLLQKTG
jgi:hypothetical protein